jgi:transposase
VQVIGVDSHKDTLAASLVDEAGRELEARTFQNTPDGHVEFVKWAQRFGGIARIGVECSATYGAAVSRCAAVAGFVVVEVPTKFSVRERRSVRRPGKSDPIDALAIARVAVRENDLPPVHRPSASEELAVLTDFRDELVVERTAVANRLHADLVVLCPGYGRRCPTLTSKAALDRVVRLLRGASGLRADVARQRVARLRQLDRQIAGLRLDILRRVRETGTTLTEIPGVGALVAARISPRSATSRATRPLRTSPRRTARRRSRLPRAAPSATG